MGFARIAALLISAVGVRFGGAVIGFALQVLLARWLAPEELGGWFIIISVASFSGLLIAAGLPTLGLTVLARYQSAGRTGMARQFLAKGASQIRKLGLVLALPALVLLFLLPIEHSTRLAVATGLLAAPATALIRLNGASANSVRKFLTTIIPDYLGKTLFVLAGALLWIAATGGLSLAVVAVLFFAVNYATAIGVALYLGKNGALPWMTMAVPARVARVWARRSWPLILVALSMIAMADFLVLISTALLPKAEIALIGIAIKLAALTGYFTQASHQFVLRDLAGALSQRNPGEARALLIRTNLTCAAAIGGAALFFELFGGWVLAIFGASYVAAHPVLMLLMLAQAIRALGGLNVHLLSLRGGQIKLGRACLASFAVITVCAASLVPWLGINAIGWAAVAGELAWAVSVAILTRSHVGWCADLFSLFFPGNKVASRAVAATTRPV